MDKNQFVASTGKRSITKRLFHPYRVMHANLNFCAVWSGSILINNMQQEYVAFLQPNKDLEYNYELNKKPRTVTHAIRGQTCIYYSCKASYDRCGVLMITVSPTSCRKQIHQSIVFTTVAHKRVHIQQIK